MTASSAAICLSVMEYSSIRADFTAENARDKMREHCF